MRKRKKKKIELLVLGISVLVLLTAGIFGGSFIFNNLQETEKVVESSEDNSENEEVEIPETSSEREEKTENSFEKHQEKQPEEKIETIDEKQEEQMDLVQGVQEFLENMTLEQKIAQMFMITPEALTGYSSVTQASDVTKNALQEYPVGGIIFMGNNVVDQEQLKQMTSNLQTYAMEISEIPLFLGIDEEGGTVARIGNNENFSVKKFSNMSSIGAQNDLGQAYEVGDTIGAYLSEYGFNLDFAPVADVLSNQENQVVKERCFGNEPEQVAAMDLEVMEGLQNHNVYACMKHFPGHGGTAGDTHQGYAYTKSTMEEMKEFDLIPFQKGIEQGISFIMISHISVPNGVEEDVPASISYELVTELLREEMGYEGIAITDAMNMGAITENYGTGEATVRAIEAGIDIVLMPKDFKQAYNAVVEAVNSGRIPEERIDESVKRILAVKKQKEIL